MWSRASSLTSIKCILTPWNLCYIPKKTHFSLCLEMIPSHKQWNWGKKSAQWDRLRSSKARRRSILAELCGRFFRHKRKPFSSLFIGSMILCGVSDNVFWCPTMFFDVQQCLLISYNVFWYPTLFFLMSNNGFWYPTQSVDVLQCLLMSYNVFWCPTISLDYQFECLISLCDTLLSYKILPSSFSVYQCPAMSCNALYCPAILYNVL